MLKPKSSSLIPVRTTQTGTVVVSSKRKKEKTHKQIHFSFVLQAVLGVTENFTEQNVLDGNEIALWEQSHIEVVSVLRLCIEVLSCSLYVLYHFINSSERKSVYYMINIIIISYIINRFIFSLV